MKRPYISQYEKIKLSLKDKTKDELIRIIQEKVCDKNGNLPIETARKVFFSKPLAQRVFRNIGILSTLSTDELVEIIAVAKVMEFPAPSFDLKTFWKNYYHGKRSPRAPPQGGWQ